MDLADTSRGRPPLFLITAFGGKGRLYTAACLSTEQHTAAQMMLFEEKRFLKSHTHRAAAHRGPSFIMMMNGRFVKCALVVFATLCVLAAGRTLPRGAAVGRVAAMKTAAAQQQSIGACVQRALMTLTNLSLALRSPSTAGVARRRRRRRHRRVVGSRLARLGEAPAHHRGVERVPGRRGAE